MARAVFVLALCLALEAVLAYDYGYDRSYGAGTPVDSIVNAVRSKTDSWTPNPNPKPLWTYVAGVHWATAKKERLPVGILAALDEDELPEQFDAREKWTSCPSLRVIRDQGCCGSCWAISAVEAMTDRWCIHSRTNEQFNFGAYDPLSCCVTCGKGCEGGQLAPVWNYWVETGISSGGEYNTTLGCHPYPIHECDPSGELHETPKCSAQCEPGYPVTSMAKDRRYGRVAYSVPQDEDAIKQEIYVNGPVQAAFVVFQDFKLYKRGVYRHVHGLLEGGHAVKIIGWGVENGQKYWLCANSWGADWGENGYFKFVRGENHLGIEQIVHAGLPSYKKGRQYY